MSPSISPADGTIEQVVADAQRRRRGTRGRSAAAGNAEPALARVPARDRRTHGTRERGWRQLLDVAAGDVRVSRPGRRRRVRGDCRAGVCRDAEGRVHGGRRIPLRSSRSAGQAVCRSGGARAPDRRRRRGDRHRAHAAAGLLRPCRIRRDAARRGPAAVRAHARCVCAPGRDARRRCRDVGLESGRRAAQPARRDPGGAGRGRRARAARCADSHPRRRAGAGGRGLRGLERRAADRVAARSRRARCALVHRACDAHDAG